MKLYIMNGKKINKVLLPNNKEEFYTVDYNFENSNEKYQLMLHNLNGVWNLKSNGSVNVVDNGILVDEILLKEYNIYYIKILGIEKIIAIYAMPNQETFMPEYSYENMQLITIGKSETCNISYDNDFIPGEYITIKHEENGWIAYDNSNLGFFLNGENVKQAKLKYGDLFFIFGMKIIWMPNFIMINFPNNKVKIYNIPLYNSNQKTDNLNIMPVSDEESAIPLYKDDEYFYHIPRIRETIENEEIQIDQPPTSEKKEELPWWITLGTSLTLIASSLVMGINVYNNIMRKAEFMIILPQLIMILAMIIGSIIMPKILKSYQKKKEQQKEKLRQEKYKEYLNDKKIKIDEILKNQSQILIQNNREAIECLEIVKNKSMELWSREIRDDDFLSISIGRGTVNSKLTINAPEEHFSLEKDNLFEDVYKVVNDSKKLKNVPITYSFCEENLNAIVFNCTKKNDYLNNLFVKLLTLHSGIDLKIVIFTNKNRESFWNYIKRLSHCWNDEKNIRFFATTIDEVNEISAYLDEEYKKRKESLNNNNSETLDDFSKEDLFKNYVPYYLIVTDDYNTYKNSQIILDVLKSKKNIGFSLLTIADTVKNTPNQCEKFIQIGEREGCIFTKKLNSKNQQVFNIDNIVGIDMENFAFNLSKIPLMPKDGLKVLPTTLPFLEMFNVSKIEQLNILNRWQTNNPVISLATPVGVHSDLETFKLDLHEKFHGPHGLIAGMTGSGKSEFIITYILSMAVNYHPYEVQFVLIDYKGGGLAGAFENKEMNIKIPHLIGTITNLDTSEMNRALVSIESELKRRQKIFNETKDILGESTIDIYKYQRLYREGAVKKPMAHLFIISDEFAELKSQQPEFMNQLVSTARIGRSLGVHLILATQKPSGVVNDQIWSNSKFKVCLKVQDRGDSQEMLKRPEAASIKEVGRFYLQVGYNDYFDIGQSGWGGAKYIPTNKIIKSFDNSINFINNTGYVIKSINDEIKKENLSDLGDQLTNTVRYISELASKNNITTQNLWLNKIPDIIYVDKLKQKYNYIPKPYCITPVIGEYDSPSTQSQHLLNLDLTFCGNTIIYGQSGSGKESLLTTIIWSTIMEHTPNEVNIYIIDCGAETLKMFNKIPHIGDVVDISEEEKITEIFNMIFEIMEERKELFADYAGNYINYCQNSGHKLPLIIVIINNYDNFIESYGRLSENIQSIYRECSKYGIKFIISAVTPNVIRPKMAQCFDNKISLQLPNDNYRDILGCPRGLIPAKIYGRGIVLNKDEFYEFQTAIPVPNEQLIKVIKQVSTKLNEYYKFRAKKVFIIPEKIGLNMVIKKLNGLNKVPIGFGIKSKEIETYNFDVDPINLILANAMADKLEFVNGLIRIISQLANTNVIVIDLVNAYDKNIKNVFCINNNFNDNFKIIYSNLKNSEKNNVKNIYFVIGAGELENRVSADVQNIISKIMTEIKKSKNNKFIFADDVENIKLLKVETWFESTINTVNGIWLGEGVSNQNLINVTNLTLDDKKMDFPYMTYMIVGGRAKCIKCMIDEEIKENEEIIIIDEK